MSLTHRLKRALEGFSTPLLPDDYTRLVNPLWSTREFRGRIVAVRRPTDTTAELVIRRGWGVPAEFRAGQHIGIGVRVDGRYVWRSYSLTCAPQPADGLLTVTVKAIDDGRLSRHLVRNARPGIVVRLALPAGDFHLDEPVPDKLLFLTAGSGITPVMSMLRDLRGRFGGDGPGAGPDVVHLHSARTAEDVLFDAELAAMTRECPWYTRILRLTGRQGRIAARDLPALVPDLAERQVYACGPAALLDDVEAHVPGVRTERFALDRGSTDAAGGKVVFPGRGEIEVDGATTILEAGERAGIQLPYGCRMGICATCVRQLADGTARDLRTGATHEAGERIRVCVCVPAGDIELEP